MGLRLTSAADYAVRAMIHLACLPEGGVALRSEIAEAQGIPASFMAKILRSLVRARILRSSRGVNGGFTLARDPSEIALLEIVEAIEGPLALTNCSAAPCECRVASDCPACSVWVRVQDSMKQILADADLESLVSTPRRNGRLVESIGEPSTAVKSGTGSG